MPKEPYSISGLVKEVCEMQTFQSGFKKQTLVIVDDPDAEYPNYAAIEYAKDKTALLAPLKKGDAVSAKFWPDAHSWKDPKTGKVKWFSSLRGVELSVDSVPEPATPTAADVAAAEEAAGGSDDLPF